METANSLVLDQSYIDKFNAALEPFTSSLARIPKFTKKAIGVFLAGNFPLITTLTEFWESAPDLRSSIQAQGLTREIINEGLRTWFDGNWHQIYSIRREAMGLNACRVSTYDQACAMTERLFAHRRLATSLTSLPDQTTQSSASEVLGLHLDMKILLATDSWDSPDFENEGGKAGQDHENRF